MAGQDHLCSGAKHADRPKDEADFTAVLPEARFGPPELAHGSASACPPDHPWLQRI